MKDEKDLESICDYALENENFQGNKKCCKCNLKIYKEPIICFEPEKFDDCYFYFNYNHGKYCEKWVYENEKHNK